MRAMVAVLMNRVRLLCQKKPGPQMSYNLIRHIPYDIWEMTSKSIQRVTVLMNSVILLSAKNAKVHKNFVKSNHF